MTRFILFLSCTFGSICCLAGQSINPSNPEIAQDFDGVAFPSFVEDLSAAHGLQFYFFPGWVADLRVQQRKTPAKLTDILDWTFSETEYRYFINAQGQIVLTSGSAIRSEIKWKTKDTAEEKTDEEISSLVNASLENQLENFETEWFTIGDPAAPEQKPKVKLSGVVSNSDTKEALEGAIIYVDELAQGTTTDSSGYYELLLPQGRYQVTFQSVGLKEKVRKLQLYASGQMDVGLGALILNIEEVVVSANKKASIRNVQMGVDALKTETIKELPTLLGEVDVIRSALMLPGVQSVGEFSSGINVRGGGADQNLVLLNGAPVFNASHLFGFTSSFSSDVIDGFELYKSSIPAKYGGRISSVLEVQMKEGANDRWWVKGGISPVTGRLSLEGPLIKDKTTLLLSARSTYADWILDRIDNASIRNSRANYYDLTARVKTKIAQNDFLDVSGYFSNDNFKLNGDSTFGYQNSHVVVNYQHAFGDNLFGTFSGIYSGYQFKVSSDKQPLTGFELSYRINYGEGRAHFSYAPGDNHQLNFGFNLVNYRLDPGLIKGNTPESITERRELARENALEGSVYLSDEWSVSDAFSISAGLRFTHYMFLGPQAVNEYRPNAPRIEDNIIGTRDFGSGALVQSYNGPEYRLSMRYALDPNNSIKLALNRNRQYLSMLFNSATVSPTATWKLSDRHILPQTGDQFSLGFFRNMMNDNLEFSLEGYYKIIQNMVEYKAGAELLLNESLETDVINGDGRAYGVELLLKKNGRRLNGWLSYTYSRTRFRSNSDFPEDQINEGKWFPSNFDKPHDLTFVSYLKATRRFSISTNVTFSTGRPVTIPVAKYLFANGLRLQYSRRNEFRVPDYFRWDISINLDGNHRSKKLAHSSWSMSLYNVTGRNNVYSIYFVSDGVDTRGYQLSIFGRPFLTLTYNFKI